MTYLEVFFLLQVLDLMTTLIGLRMGASELSPFVSWVMRIGGPITGLSAIKLLGFVLAGICVWSQRPRVLHWVNYTFAAVVLWNVFNILRALGVPA